MSEKKFVNIAGRLCPFCESDDIKVTSPKLEETDENIANKDVECNQCKKEWSEVWMLQGYDSEHK